MIGDDDLLLLRMRMVMKNYYCYLGFEGLQSLNQCSQSYHLADDDDDDGDYGLNLEAKRVNCEMELLPIVG